MHYGNEIIIIYRFSWFHSALVTEKLSNTNLTDFLLLMVENILYTVCAQSYFIHYHQIVVLFLLFYAASMPLTKHLNVAIIDSNPALGLRNFVKKDDLPDPRVSTVTPATISFFKGTVYFLSFVAFDIMMAISFYQNKPFGGFSFPCGLFSIHFLFWWIFWFCGGITCNCPLTCIINIIIPAVGINIMAPIFWSNCSLLYYLFDKIVKIFLWIISLKCYESVSLLLEIVIVWGKKK